tara:strand:+ start:7590 stop:7835 length:246 start_codon:yes stop_codon:yes gene_type:complete
MLIHNFIIDTFFFNVALLLDLPDVNIKTDKDLEPEQRAKEAFENMYKDYKNNSLEPSRFNPRVFQAFKFYIKNRELLCLTQ